MNLSRAVRKQLIALCIVRGIIDEVRRVNASDTHVDQQARRALRKQREIMAKLVPVNPDYSIDFQGDRKKERQFRRDLQKAYDDFLAQWPGEKLDGREYVSAVLVYLDDIRSGRMAEDFQELQGLIQDIYEGMDPELEADPQMEYGERAGSKLLAMMEG